MASNMRTFHSGRLHTIKDGVTLQDLKDRGYFERHPDAIIVKVPSESTLHKWNDAGMCKAVDGCIVEPDGVCPHGYPAWLIVMGLI